MLTSVVDDGPLNCNAGSQVMARAQTSSSWFHARLSPLRMELRYMTGEVSAWSDSSSSPLLEIVTPLLVLKVTLMTFIQSACVNKPLKPVL